MIKSSESPAAWEQCLAVVRPALLLAPLNYLQDVGNRLAADGVQAAVVGRDTAALFDWIVRLIDRQGISNAAAIKYAEQHGSARWQEVQVALARPPLCSKLFNYWHFHDCGYRKGARTCARRQLLEGCALPQLPGRKGGLNQAAFSLALFIRDICAGDLVGWIDDRLAAADPGKHATKRGVVMRTALLEPLANIVGTGPKVWSMILAELLLAADPDRKRWVTAGASFVAVDSLVHNYLYRTGILRQLDEQHEYGPRCYAPGGCADVIAALAERVDAREFDPSGPACFPRMVQYSIWHFCAADGLSICHGGNIDDRVGCAQQFCPSFPLCARLPLVSSPR